MLIGYFVWSRTTTNHISILCANHMCLHGMQVSQSGPVRTHLRWCPPSCMIITAMIVTVSPQWTWLSGLLNPLISTYLSTPNGNTTRKIRSTNLSQARSWTNSTKIRVKALCKVTHLEHAQKFISPLFFVDTTNLIKGMATLGLTFRICGQGHG